VSTLVQVKQQLVILKVEGNFLKSMVENLRKETQLVASNQCMSKQREHEDIIIQLMEDMEIGEKEPGHTTTGLEELQVITPFISLFFLKLVVS